MQIQLTFSSRPAARYFLLPFSGASRIVLAASRQDEDEDDYGHLGAGVSLASALASGSLQMGPLSRLLLASNRAPSSANEPFMGACRRRSQFILISSLRSPAAPAAPAAAANRSAVRQVSRQGALLARPAENDGGGGVQERDSNGFGRLLRVGLRKMCALILRRRLARRMLRARALARWQK